MPRSNAARLMRVAGAVALVLIVPQPARALYESPTNYYASADTTTGTTLRDSLKSIMSAGHDMPSWNAVRDYLPFIDANPTNANQMWLVYDRTVVANSSGSRTIGFHGAYQSREHTWPDSRLSDSLDAELFFIRASDTGGTNGDRANYYYGGANLTGAARVINPTASESQRRFFAGDLDKGDVARGLLYGATRYAGTLSLNNTAVAQPNNSNVMGDLDTLLHWHYLDTPDLFERRRNDVIYRGDDLATSGDDSNFGGTNNRNAYIDRPEYAWSVYVDQFNDTKLTLEGGTTSSDGSSATTVNLGRVLKGGAVPTAKTVKLNKTGVDGTYYRVTPGTGATSDLTGGYNAFAMDGPGSRTLSVGLASNTSTAAAGLKTGTVTIDNLDVTRGQGVGFGAQDGDDVATVVLSVLDSSNSSFSAAADVDVRSIDFGTVAQNAAAGLESFTVYDLASSLGESLTAWLDLDSFLASGDDSKFATTLATFTNLTADGVGKTFAASFDTSTLGTFAATYVLNFSDENLSGTQTTSSLTLTLTGTVVAVPEPAALAATVVLVVTFARRRRIF